MAAGALLTTEEITEVKTILGEFKTQYKNVADEIVKLGKADSDTLVKIDKISDDMVAFQKKHEDAVKRVDAVEQKQLAAPAAPVEVKTVGQQLIEDAGFIAFAKEPRRGGYTLQMKRARRSAGRFMGQKDIQGITQQWPQMIEYIAAPAEFPLLTDSLIPQGTTTAGAIEYIQETSYTNLAAPVAEGAAKPQSELVYTPITLPVQTIAHYFKISKQTFDDLPFLAAQVQQRGMYFLELKEDNQLLNGTGISPQLKGFMPIAAAAPAPPATTPPAPANTLVDAIGMAVFDLASKGYIADGTVANPGDWGKIAMIKNSLGNYIFANPLDYSQAGSIWGTRFVTSPNMAAGAFLTGAFRGYSQALQRSAMSVQIAAQNEDDFIKNMYTILIEERLVLLIYVNAAFEKGVQPVALEAEGGNATTMPAEGGGRAARQR